MRVCAGAAEEFLSVSVVHLLVVPFVWKQVAAVSNHCMLYPHLKTRKVDFIFPILPLIAGAELSEFRTLCVCYKSARFQTIWPSFFICPSSTGRAVASTGSSLHNTLTLLTYLMTHSGAGL